MASTLSISMLCFGLSKTFWGLVLSRSLNGALNGNIGPIKSMMAEMSDATNIAQAYAFMPIAWSSGAILGPIIGGLLARPVERFPDLFGQNKFLKEYPYFLPCAIPAIFSLIAWLLAFFLLKETLPAPISISRLLNIKTGRKEPRLQNAIGSIDASDVAIPGPTSNTIQNLDDDCSQAERPVSLRSLLTSRVLISAGNYATLAFVDIAFRAVQPVYLSTPVRLGGLGLSLPTIGKILSAQGIANGIFQVFCFAPIHNHWGSKKTFIAGIATAIPAFLTFPAANALARSQGYSVPVWVIVGYQTISGVFLGLSHGSIFIFITAASPNRASLGATNGLCQMFVSITRAIGPAVATSLFSLSIEQDYLGGYLVYYVLVVMTGAAILFGLQLPRQILIS